MRHIKRQRTLKEARLQMSDVAAGDTVIVHIRRKEIPCMVRICKDTICSSCVLVHEDCLQFRGSWMDDENRKAFVPAEDAVE